MSSFFGVQDDAYEEEEPKYGVEELEDGGPGLYDTTQNVVISSSLRHGGHQFFFRGRATSIDRNECSST